MGVSNRGPRAPALVRWSRRLLGRLGARPRVDEGFEGLRERHAAARQARGERYTLIQSAGLPPSWSGQAIALARLCVGLDPASYCLCTSSTSHRFSDTAASDDFLPVDYHETPPETIYDDAACPVEVRLERLAGIVHQRAVSIARIAADAGCDGLVACTGELIDPPAVAIAARALGIPFHLYVFDDFERQFPNSVESAFAQKHGAALARDAASVIVPNEFMGDVMKRRHGVEPVLVRNACSADAVSRAGSELASDRPGAGVAGDAPTVLYTGAVYHVNGASINLVGDALERVGTGRGRLVLRTAQTAEQLVRAGVVSPKIERREHVKPEDIEREQREADVLLIPFNFGAETADIARTSAPMKLGDYLVSGTPILAIVPPDSFLADHLGRHEAALVVTEPDPAAVSQALDRLLTDGDLRGRLSRNAQRLAVSEYDPATSRARFLEAITRGRPAKR